MRLVYLSVAIVFGGCGVVDLIGTCNDTVIVSAISPDERYIATVYQRACATKNSITYVTIRPSTSRFQGGGHNPVFAVDWPVPVGLIWSDVSNLRVECIRCGTDKVFKRDDRWNDVAIAYQSYGE